MRGWSGRPVRVLIYNLLLVLAVTPYAWWRGGAPERWAAAIMIIGSAATFAAIRISGVSYRTVEPAILAVDLVAGAAFVALAYLANRSWTSWLAAIHFTALFVHALKWHDPGIEGWLYQIFMKVQAWAMLALIPIGVWRHRSRLMRHGADASWRTSSAWLVRAMPASWRQG